MMRLLIKCWLWASLMACLFCFYARNTLPLANAIESMLYEEPKQSSITSVANAAPFDVNIAPVNYQVQPKYEYELSGLVVSYHDTDSWLDYIHREWNDQLNVMDVCVLWGNNLKNDHYREIEFWSQQYTCHFQTNSDHIYQAFDQTAISNNHLLAKDPKIIKALRNIKIGDQIYIKGVLAAYAHQYQGQNFFRDTSITRTDTGMGACETIYVTNVSILKRNTQPWRTLLKISLCSLILSIICWWRLPLRFDR